MARHTFLGDMASWVMATGSPATSTGGLSGDVALVIPSQEVTFWDAESGGTQQTDLLDDAGNPITSVTAGSDGSLPQISGPDGTRLLWADASGGAGPRRACVATDIGASLTAVESSQASDEEQLAFLGQTAPVFVYYNTQTNSYPQRPSTGTPVWWVGPVAPQFGGGYATDGLDYWIGPSS